jgi:hypothetical protein
MSDRSLLRREHQAIVWTIIPADFALLGTERFEITVALQMSLLSTEGGLKIPAVNNGDVLDPEICLSHLQYGHVIWLPAFYRYDEADSGQEARLPMEPQVISPTLRNTPPVMDRLLLAKVRHIKFSQIQEMSIHSPVTSLGPTTRFNI